MTFFCRNSPSSIPVTYPSLSWSASPFSPAEVDAADTTWVGTITAEGNVTTVVNESGSVWGGTATLVEELSIGVPSGADEYMLDDSTTVFADHDRIYVVQPSIPAVRLYDYQGAFLGNLGAPGQGPGEYNLPLYAAGISNGPSFVYDGEANRINVYDLSGQSSDTWTLPNAACCVWPLALSADGMLWAPVYHFEPDSAPGSPRFGVQAFGGSGPEGAVLWVPEIDYERLTVSVLGDEYELVPFAPRLTWAVAPRGVVVGISNLYRFQLLRDDGTSLVVTRYWEPVPVHPEQAEWRRKRVVAETRAQVPGWVWEGDQIPLQQPAFDTLIPTASGEVWVARKGTSHRVDDCQEDPSEDLGLARSRPCWRSEEILDAFGNDGRYLGEVDVPVGLRPAPQSLFVRDALVLGVIEDDAGTIMVKRYRLVLPGER